MFLQVAKWEKKITEHAAPVQKMITQMLWRLQRWHWIQNTEQTENKEKTRKEEKTSFPKENTELDMIYDQTVVNKIMTKHDW